MASFSGVGLLMAAADSYLADGRTSGKSHLLARTSLVSTSGTLPFNDICLRGREAGGFVAADVRGLQHRRLVQPRVFISSLSRVKPEPEEDVTTLTRDDGAAVHPELVHLDGMSDTAADDDDSDFVLVGPRPVHHATAELSAERRELLLHQEDGINLVIQLLGESDSDADASNDEETVGSYLRMLREVAESTQQAAPPPVDDGDTRQQPVVPVVPDSSPSPQLRSDAMREIVRERVREVMGQVVQDDTPLTDVGLDSLAGNELRMQLARSVGVVMLPMELVFNYPSIAALAGFLTDGLVHDSPEHAPVTQAALQQQVLGVVASVLGQQVTVEEPLVNAGMDSISANELRSQLASAVGLAMLPAEVVFDYPTVKDLVGFLQAYVQPDSLPAPVAGLDAPAPSRAAEHLVATALTVDRFDAFVSALKDMLAEALVLEGAWPSFYDDVPFGELGLSSDLLAVVHEHFRVQVQMSEHDTLGSVLRAIRALLPE